MANRTSSSRLPERNPATQKSYMRQSFWQIILPISLGGLIVLAIAVLVCLAEPGTASAWADISLVFLLIPVMVVALLFLGLFSALVYGVFRLIEVIPPYARLAQAFAFKMERRIHALTHGLVEPIIKVSSLKAGLQALRRK